MSKQAHQIYLLVLVCLINGIGLIAQTNFTETFVICQGESIFLPALQQFAQPPQGPQGTRPCQPQLSNIAISPTQNTIKEDRRGYTVAPQVTTIYEVESIPTCGPPGFGGTVGSTPGSSFLNYQVIVENNCQTEIPPVFEDFPWLTNFVNPTSCSNEKVEVYQSGVYAYLLVTNAAGQSVLYNQDGVFYCQNSTNYDCVTAYNLGQAIDTWQCGGTSPNTCELPSGIDFCGECYKDISIYEFRGDRYIVYRAQTAGCRAIEIQVSSCGTGTFGCVTGPAIGFDPGCPIFFGEAVLVETLWTDAACQAIEEPVVIRTAACIGERFEFPFPSDCNGRQIQIPTTNDIIQQISVNGATRTVNAVLKNYGSFERTHLVPNGAGDCVEVKYIYEMVASGECPNVQPEAPDELFFDYPWLTDIINPNACTNEKIAVYQSGIYFYLLVTDASGQATLYNQDGLFYCQQSANYDCVAAYNLGQPVNTWQCTSDVACPAVFVPVCGVDGNTYDACPAGLRGIEIAYNGACISGPLDCDRFTGEVVGNACDTYILVGDQLWSPTYININTTVLPSIGDIVQFDFYPLDPSFLPNDACFENIYGEAPIFGNVPCLNVVGQVAFEESFVICRGESVFLEAKNDFPAGPGAPCSPRLRDISISSSRNARKEGTTGYTVSPQVSTTYAVETIVDCLGPAGPGGFVNPVPKIFRYYQVRVEQNCNTESSQPNCANNTGTVFFRNCDNRQQYYFIQTSDGRIYDPYFDASTQYTPVEGQQVNFDFVDASFSSPCSIAEKAINITCIEIGDNNPQPGGTCVSNRGEIFYENCDDGTQFFFIRTTTGAVLDVYFAEGIQFVKYPGQQVRFDFVPAGFNSPCSIADQAVIVTCIEEASSNEEPPSAIFQIFPWLTGIVNPNNCGNARIEVYQDGAYQYVFVENNGAGTLYFEDGSFYCMDSPNYNCRNIYGLSNRIAAWTCNGNLQETATERNQIIARLEGFVAYPNPTLGRLQVQLPVLSQQAQLSISNLFGQQLLKRTLAPNDATQTMTIDLKDYQNGIYYLELQTKGQRGIQKIIKQDMQ